jgi:hypothetical protein
MTKKRDTAPNASRDVIVQLITQPPAERWGVFLANTFVEAHSDRWVAEWKGEALAEEKGVSAWLMPDCERYQRLDWQRALTASLRARYERPPSP